MVGPVQPVAGSPITVILDTVQRVAVEGRDRGGGGTIDPRSELHARKDVGRLSAKCSIANSEGGSGF